MAVVDKWLAAALVLVLLKAVDRRGRVWRAMEAVGAMLLSALVFAALTFAAASDVRPPGFRGPSAWPRRRLHDLLPGDLLLHTDDSLVDGLATRSGAVTCHTSLVLRAADGRGAVEILSAGNREGVYVRHMLPSLVMDDNPRLRMTLVATRALLARKADGTSARAARVLAPAFADGLRMAVDRLATCPFDESIFRRWAAQAVGLDSLAVEPWVRQAKPGADFAEAPLPAPLCCTSTMFAALRLAGVLASWRGRRLPTADDMLFDRGEPLDWSRGFVGWGEPAVVESSA